MARFYSVVRVEYPYERKYSSKVVAGPYDTLMAAHLRMLADIETQEWFMNNDGAISVVGEVVEQKGYTPV